MVYSIVGIMLIPILATFVYSLSSRWGATVLPVKKSCLMRFYVAVFSITSNRSVQSLQIAVDDEFQVVQVLPSGQRDESE